MKIAIIINERAGALIGTDNREVKARIVSLLRRYGLSGELFLLSSDNADEVLERAAVSGAEVVVAGGGDGTVRSVASTVLAQKRVLGILPLGTMNHLARDLRIPADLDQAFSVLAEGFSRVIDVGEVNGHLFLNNASLGIYAVLVSERKKERQRSARGKWLATLIGVFRALRQLRAMPLNLEYDGRSRVRRLPFLFVGNNEYNGNIFSESWRSCLSGGKLWVCIPRSHLVSWVPQLVRFSVFRGTGEAYQLESVHVDRIRVDAGSGCVLVATDGDVFSITPPLTFRLHKQVLRVMVPRLEAES